MALQGCILLVPFGLVNDVALQFGKDRFFATGVILSEFLVL